MKNVVSYDSPSAVKAMLPVMREGGSGSMVQETGIKALPPMVELLREGLPMAEFFYLQNLLGIPEEDLAKLIGISNATLHRRKKSQQLATSESERVIRFARLFGLVMEVFETEEGARGWLKTANPGTAGESPLQYADTEFGAREVENLLGRIEHGVF